MNHQRVTNKNRNKNKNKNRNRNRNRKGTHKVPKTRKIYKNSMGGAAVKAGSYGCVFSPNLKCDKTFVSDRNTTRLVMDGHHGHHGHDDGEMISKLMYKRDADNEMEKLYTLNSLLAKIPNQDKYFLTDTITSCKPQELSSSDLDNFETCNMLIDKDITRYNINSNLDELRIINMKNGGIDMDDYLKKMNAKSGVRASLKIINENLIKLLKFGILPLNRLKFNHYDIKSGNILVNNVQEVRLIDWGLASRHDGKSIPHIITDRSFAFNIPYSVIFFNRFIRTWIHTELSRHNLTTSSTGKNEIIRIICINLVNFIIHKHAGHENTIVHIMRNLYREILEPKDGGFISGSIASSNLVDYVYTVMMKYTNDLGVFDDNAYFHEIFAFNSDIFGFVLIYESILNNLSLPQLVRDKIIKILLKYCVGSEFAVKRIDVDILVDELEDITNY